MLTRYAAVAIGLALGMTSAAVQSAPITYTVDFSFSDGSNPPGSAHVTGFLTTDGNPGTLHSSDITNFSISAGGRTSNLNSQLFFIGDALSATSNQLTWTFTGSGNDQFIFESFQGPVAGFYNGYNQLFAHPDNSTSDVVTKDFANGETFVFGSVVSAVSTVPLPSSAPLFAAALIALGAVGYGRRRKARVTTAV